MLFRSDYDHLLKLVKSVIECSCTIQKKYGTWNAEGITTLRVKIGLFSYFVRYMWCTSKVKLTASSSNFYEKVPTVCLI